MTRDVSRPELGERLEAFRQSFSMIVDNCRSALGRRPMTANLLASLSNRARDVLGNASWFAPGSQLMRDAAALLGQAFLGYARVHATAVGGALEVRLGPDTVSVKRETKVEAKSVVDWQEALAGALVARDQATFAELSAVPEAFLRAAPVKVDEYHYALGAALAAVPSDAARSLAAVEQGRRLWQTRSVAKKAAAEIDGGLFDALEALAKGDSTGFNDALFQALSAHARFWSQGDEYLASRGWVALRHLALVCLAHDRGIPIEVESPYLPPALITLTLSPTPSLDGPPKAPAEVVREQTRELGTLAGETFGRLRLEPQGYSRVDLPRVPFASFDFVYRKDGGDIVLVDTRAGDQTFEGFHGAGGVRLERGTRPYLEAVIDHFPPERSALAQEIRSALRSGKLRYYEVYQPLDAAKTPGDIEIRQFKL